MANLDGKKVRVRIAPSPTGNLHVGTARAALFNELFAKKHGGVFVVRIEDTDKARSRPEFEQNILEGLTWLGLTWDEGPDIGGPYAPYRQSEREDTYTAALRKLIDEDKAYFCSCKVTDGEKPVCACGSVSFDKRTEQERGTLPIKLRVPSQRISFTDAVRGEVTTSTDTFGGDFVIARSINDPLFHLAVVIDDALMDITHVIRGEDHLSNTAKHILLQKALGYGQPMYAHLPLLLDERRAKLSKRKSETNLLAYREAGFLSEAILNYLALLGWNPGDDREFFSHEELVKEFSFERVQKGGAIFSITKLQATNRHYLRSLKPDELLRRWQDFMRLTSDASYAIQDSAYWTAAVATEQERATTLADFSSALQFFKLDWQATYQPAMLVWKKSDQATTKIILKKLLDFLQELPQEKFTNEDLETELMAWVDREQYGRGDTLWPMRVALTGKEHSAGPFEVAGVLGKEETLGRLGFAIGKL